MFYQGDLQSGINEAVQASKMIACFVTDDGEESRMWENDLLQESDLQTGLAAQAILLRIVKGSQEESHLAAIYPLPKIPALVFIRNGALKEYLVSGTSKEDILRRLTVLLNLSLDDTASSTASPGLVTPQTDSEGLQDQPSGSHLPPQTTELQSDAIHDLLADRRIRLEAQKKEQDAKEKAERLADARARQEAEAASDITDTKIAADRKYALMQKKRQQDARDERARILKRVEDDKAERRQREAERKAQSNIIMNDQSSSIASSSRQSYNPSTDCALKVRLFDGSTIRSVFPAVGTIQESVRPWIDEQQGSDIPYTLKHVVIPRPNKNIEASEETKTLHSIGLTPNATLILVPVSDFKAAYAESGTGGLITRGASAGFSLLSSGMGAVAGAMASVLGSSTRSTTIDRQERLAPATGSPAVANIRTLQGDEGEQNDREYYNGNALTFEPRKDKEDKKDD